MEIWSRTDKRLIVDVNINGKPVPMLVDTGATVGLVSKDLRGLLIDKVRPSIELQGAGGATTAYRCNTLGTLAGKTLPQFFATDIKGVVKSIKAETGISIGGVLSLPQLRYLGAKIDTFNGKIIIE